MTTEVEHKEHDRLAEKRIIEDVEKFGWHVGLFEPTENEPSFAYTIGLWKTYGHPEIISFGLTTKTLHEILNNAGEIVKQGNILTTDQDNLDIFETVPAQFITVDKNRFSDYFGYCMWFNDYKDFPALQLVWTDRQGRFPWQPEFEREFDDRQIILNSYYEEEIKKSQQLTKPINKRADRANRNDNTFNKLWSRLTGK